MPKTLECDFPLDSEPCPQLRISDQVELRPDAGGMTGILKFARKTPARCDSLVYFLGGYLDPRSREYYACAQRDEAAFPLFTLDSVMPPRALLDAAAMMQAIAVFNPERKTAFECVWHDPTEASIIEPEDRFDAFAAMTESILRRRMALVSLFDALRPHADKQPVPVETRNSFVAFIRHLGQAKRTVKQILLHASVLQVQGIYDARVCKKLVALFNLPLFEKARGGLGRYPRELLAELWRGQCDGSLEDEVFLAEADGE